MERKKTKRIYLRINEVLLDDIKDRAKKFESITQFIFAAIDSFNDSTIHERMEAKKHLAEYYNKYDKHLANIGGNLNQAMRQVNEASIASHPTQALILNNLIPRIIECHALLKEMRKDLLETTKNIISK